MAAVGADDPADARGLLSVTGAEGDVDAVDILGERGERDAAFDDDAELDGSLGQDGLGVGLGDVEDVGVATGHTADVEPGPGGAGAAVEHGERVDAAAACLQPGQDPQGGEHLHAAGVHAHRARLGGRLREGVDDAYGHAVAGQLAGGREPHRAGPHHQHLIRRGHGRLSCHGAFDRSRAT